MAQIIVNDTFPVHGNFSQSYNTSWPAFALGVSIPWLAFYSIVYIIILIGSFVGNQLVIWSFVIEPKLRRPTNVFIFSLAVADIATCLFALPAGVVARIFTGTYVCFASARRFYHWPAFYLCSVSIGHLILITIDR